MTKQRGPRLVVVPTPIGNLEDITLRAMNTLRSADVIFAEDTRSARRLLTAVDIKAPELIALFEGNEAKGASQVVDRVRAGQVVALVSEAGMPGVSDPGCVVVEHARKEGVLVEVLPGAVAAVVALVGSGLPTQPFSFFGFLPREPSARRMLLGGLSSRSETLVFYESPRRVESTLVDMEAALGGDRKAALARELTKLHEEYLCGTISELQERCKEAPVRGECTIVVAGGSREPSKVEPEEIERQVLQLLEEGLSPKDIAGRLMLRTGKPRRHLYQLALSLGRTTPKK